jgi:hypothetical protein
MEGLLAPAWVVALATAGYMGAMAVVKIRGSNGANGESREITRALQAVTLTLTELTANLRQLPTREEIKDIAEKNRHDMRNILAGEAGQTREQIMRTEQTLVRLIERTAE